MIINDILYGRIELPKLAKDFLFIPELLRLRGVGLSNFDSLQYKDFAGPSRWDHSVGVLHLATECAKVRGLNDSDTMAIQLAALLHDVATPPFAHTLEHILVEYDHEVETSRVLGGKSAVDVAVHLSETPQFRATIQKTAYRSVDPEVVAQLVIGEDERLGFLINGSIDLDNADNVVRANRYMGFDVDPQLPLRLARYLATLDSAPIQIRDSNDPDIRLWLSYRDRMYHAFYAADDLDLGREAHLQHILRRAYEEGLDIDTLVWSTESELLAKLSRFKGVDNEASVSDNESSFPTAITELVRDYRLVRHPTLMFRKSFSDLDEFNSLSSPLALAWVERALSRKKEHFEIAAMASKKRFSAAVDDRFEIGEVGEIRFFRFEQSLKSRMLTPSVRDGLSHQIGEEQVQQLRGKQLERAVHGQVSQLLRSWAATHPWTTTKGMSSSSIAGRLDRVGDWGFVESRNRSLHWYPSTFVRTIPAALIRALGLAKKTVLDPFGGVGNTAIEAARAGGIGISGDVNPIAAMIAKAWSTFLDTTRMEHLKAIRREDLSALEPAPAPTFDRFESWHHADTALQLRQIKAFIKNCNDSVTAEFLTLCFSAILTSTTDRRGEQHGFFADNTPLKIKGGSKSPSRVDAFDLFLKKVADNIQILKWRYGLLENGDESADKVLARVRSAKVDMTTATPASYGVVAHSVSGIITSPPYLCMADYTLGQRLTYGWLDGLDIEDDFSREVGARRLRFKKDKIQVYAHYLNGFSLFVDRCRELLDSGGFVAIVLGKSTARTFRDLDLFDDVDRIFGEHGFEGVWETTRTIHWSRNHSYAKLKQERISVHRLQ